MLWFLQVAYPTNMIVSISYTSHIEESGASWITDENLQMIKKCLKHSQDPSVMMLFKRRRKKVFKGGNKSLPNF